MTAPAGDTRAPAKPRAAVFLDRDGTLIHEDGWVVKPDQVRLIDGAAAAISALHARGFVVVLVTNQSAVARGLLDEDALRNVHARLTGLLAAEGAILDAIYYCPHHPDGPIPQYAITCRCRKPDTGMIEQASRDLHLDLSESFIVGDDLRDLALAPPLGMRAVLVRTGKGAAREQQAREIHGAGLRVIDSIATLPSRLTD